MANAMDQRDFILLENFMARMNFNEEQGQWKLTGAITNDERRALSNVKRLLEQKAEKACNEILADDNPKPAEETCIVCGNETQRLQDFPDIPCPPLTGIAQVDMINFIPGTIVSPLCVHCMDCLELTGVIKRSSDIH